MRLLQYTSAGELKLVQHLDNAIPAYAILSHTWGPGDDEVTYNDLLIGAGRNKPGFEKIKFSVMQARKDGLEHSWVDTCCINTENKAELSHAIQSMFRWYQNAVRCYVYLSDVPGQSPKTKIVGHEWIQVLQKSKWFTRGWTLQELLAPSTVEFFSQDGTRIGDKRSLAQEIHQITGIPPVALDGGLLSQFSVQERLRWSEHRDTTVPEDKAYSLLGVLDITELAPCYGEGGEGAFRRLHNEIQKFERCLQDIRSTNPSDDKKRIEDTKGGLLKDSYCWILENDSFRQWHDDQQQGKLLWIKGHPGKGKTMLLCGIINELQQSMAKTTLLSYFFCQASDSRINSAIAVLRGLLYLLIRQQPSLATHVRKKYDQAGKSMFEDSNAWFALTEVFADVLQDPSLNIVYLAIDALDECVTDLPKLLTFIAKQSQPSPSSRVRWIISSRSWPDIEEQLEKAGHKIKLSLELNAASISAAVTIFIEQKVSRLAQEKKYSSELRAAVLSHLKSHANDTFLWVSLVCQNLEATSKRHVLKKLESFPAGLDSLYQRMLQQINRSDDADICKHILALVTLVYRPITLHELQALVEQLDDITDGIDSTTEIIGFCGSFLTLRTNTIYFVHQSAKDFILTKAVADVFPSGQETVQSTIVTRSIQIMSETLRRNMYNLRAFEDRLKPPTPDPLAASRYSCIYWIDHLRDSVSSSEDLSLADRNDLRDEGPVHLFVEKKFLYWLEALSLCKMVSKGVASTGELHTLIKVSSPKLQ